MAMPLINIFPISEKVGDYEYSKTLDEEYRNMRDTDETNCEYILEKGKEGKTSYMIIPETSDDYDKVMNLYDGFKKTEKEQNAADAILELM